MNQGSSGSSDIGEPGSPQVVINEVDCRGHEWVELTVVPGDGSDPLNTAIEVDLSGWSITDDPSDETHRYGFSQGTSLAAGEFLVVEEETESAEGFPFGIKCGEERVYLLADDGVEVDGLDVPELVSGQTWGRLPDGTGAFAATLPTPGESNITYLDASQSLFDPFSVGALSLTLDSAALAALAEDPREYVAGTMSYTPPDGQAEGPLDVGIRLKGGAGSFRPLDDKPAFKIQVDFTVDNQEFHSLTRLTLNNLAQDPTLIREALVYHVFRELDVPAPRVGYLEVSLNGEDYGLYANIETPDRTFLARWFGSTNHLYEGEYGADVTPDGSDRYQVDTGDESDRSGLDNLIQALGVASVGNLLEATEDLVDWDEVIPMMAVELWSGHWDAYAPSANNYFLHEDGEGRFSLIPWGADQAFTMPMPYHMGQGVLFRRCMSNADCLARYDETLLDLLDRLDELDLADHALALAEVTAPWVGEYEGWTGGVPGHDADVNADGEATVQQLMDFMEERTAALEDLVPCLDGTVSDQDGDGFVCDMDCDESDDSIHYGAIDLCDGIDQDCNGEPDDRPECPDCRPIDRDGHAYRVCTRQRPHREAEERCGEEGMHLVKIESAQEEQWLVGQAQAIRPGFYWMGLTLEGEGETLQYRWWDGSEPTYTHWASETTVDQPLGRCVVVGETGEWSARDCEFPARTLCE